MTIDAAVAGPPLSITTIDGETRLVTRTWPDGSWDCPFCSAVCDPKGQYYQLRSWPGLCANPACIVGGRGDAESVAKIRLERQQDEERKSRRAFLLKAQDEAAAEREHNRQAALEAFMTEAREHGYCARCWTRSTDWGRWLDRQKKVKHRKPENCPVVRRRR